MKTFRSYQLAKELYREVKALKLRGALRDQLTRASLSICLNLAEGTDRASTKDRTRFFRMAFTSLREVQAIIDIEQITPLDHKADYLAACIYKLCRICERQI